MLTADIWEAETQSREAHVKMGDVTFRRRFLSFLDFFFFFYTPNRFKPTPGNSPSLRGDVKS